MKYFLITILTLLTTISNVYSEEGSLSVFVSRDLFGILSNHVKAEIKLSPYKKKSSGIKVQLRHVKIIDTQVHGSNKATITINPDLYLVTNLIKGKIPCIDIPLNIDLEEKADQRISYKGKPKRDDFLHNMFARPTITSKITRVKVSLPNNESPFDLEKINSIKKHLIKAIIKKIYPELMEKLKSALEDLSFDLRLPYKCQLEKMKIVFPEPKLQFTSQAVVVNYGTPLSRTTQLNNKSKVVIACNNKFLENFFSALDLPSSQQLKFIKKYQLIPRISKENGKIHLKLEINLELESEKYFPRAGTIKTKIVLPFSMTHFKSNGEREVLGLSLLNTDQAIQKLHAAENKSKWQKTLQGLIAIVDLYFSYRPVFLPSEYEFFIQQNGTKLKALAKKMWFFVEDDILWLSYDVDISD